MWFKKEVSAAPPAAQHRIYKFEDFVDPHPELPKDAPRIDVLEKEVQRLREQVSDLKVTVKALESSVVAVKALESSVVSSEKGIEDWFRRHIARLAADAAKQFDSARLAAEKAEIEQHIQQVAEAIFQREAQGLFQACVRAVLRQLGKGL